MDMTLFKNRRYGKQAIDALNEFIQQQMPDGDGSRWSQDQIAKAWRGVLFPGQIEAACRYVATYNGFSDWNAMERLHYMQARKSFEDVQYAIETLLDFMGNYGPDPRYMLEKGYRDYASEYEDDLIEYPDLTLTGLLFGLQQGIRDYGDPEKLIPESHHQKLGPLNLGQPITLNSHKPDAAYFGLGFEIEAKLRYFMRGKKRLEVGDTMPAADDCYSITALFIKATLDESATVKKVRNRMNSLLKEYPNASWAGWPALPGGFLYPRTTSQARKYRKAHRRHGKD